ncbi:MAG: hypothetical protein OEW05_11320 [Candidatus Aminicenantes bacterium]|nr:hypothetical protein [Candidatus Aminicenantes bacterium]
MKTTVKTLILILMVAVTISSPVAFSCHGKLKWRFMPREEALKYLAMVEAREREGGAAGTLDEPPPNLLDQWFTYYANPVLRVGPAGAFDDKSADCQSIGWYDGQYMMWYIGTSWDFRCEMGVATSPDGLNWTKYEGNPVLRIAEDGAWDDSILICQAVLFDEQEQFYKMWYVGANKKGAFGIGYATSPDGFHWTKYAGNPVMTVTQLWEYSDMEGQTVLKTPEGYKMWYGSYDIETEKCNIGYAWSPDGINWTKYPWNPVFTTNPGHWDGYSVDTPDVQYKDGVYHMWYKGWNDPNGVGWIGHATSTDGISWVRDPKNPLIFTAPTRSEWDSYEVYRPRVSLGPDGQGGKSMLNKMWFSGRNYSLRARVGYAIQFGKTPLEEQAQNRFPHLVQNRLQADPVVLSRRRTNIGYFTPWAGRVTVDILDVAGQKVRTLVDAYALPGIYEVDWDHRANDGRPVPPGVYYVEVRAKTRLLTKEFVIER